jgi:hypothetical protein
VRAAGDFVAAHTVEGQGKILGPGGEHAPHVAGITPAQLAERRVAEHHVVGVAGAHGLGIKTLEGTVELGDQGVMGIAHGLVPQKGLDGRYDNPQGPGTLLALTPGISHPTHQGTIPLLRA